MTTKVKYLNGTSDNKVPSERKSWRGGGDKKESLAHGSCEDCSNDTELEGSWSEDWFKCKVAHCSTLHFL